ncbi:hypothetical protein GCM10010390_90220 [Streptomyces mordarskii]|uniref:Uncharacterized protein n=1 Tax=Streptomyces mordarskii TaxID=1226758 RepID=A0ABN1ERZ8_9ACTN
MRREYWNRQGWALCIEGAAVASRTSAMTTASESERALRCVIADLWGPVVSRCPSGLCPMG